MKSTKQYKSEVLLRFRKWLQDWIDRKGYSQHQAAMKLGTTATTINMVLKGTRGASDELMLKMINNSGENLRPFWDEYQPDKQEVEAEDRRKELKLHPAPGVPHYMTSDEMEERGFFTVPFSDNMKLAAGEGGSIPITDEANESVIVVHGPSIRRRNAKNLQAFRVGGPSMEPLIADGGIVLADLSHNNIKHIKDDRIYVVCWDLDDGQCAVKYLRWFEKGKIVSIESEDRFYKPVLKRIDEVVLIGKVFWAWREFPD